MRRALREGRHACSSRQRARSTRRRTARGRARCAVGEAARPSISTPCRRRTRARSSPTRWPTPAPARRPHRRDRLASASRRATALHVVAPDRTGLLATVAGALALAGFDIDTAAAFSHPDGMALEVFTGRRPLRAARDATRTRDRGGDARRGPRRRTDLDEQLRGADPPVPSGHRHVRPRRPRAVDPEASAYATVVEVHTPDDVGLLARVAAVFVDLDLDVAQAIVSTRGRPGRRRVLPARPVGCPLRRPARGRGAPGDPVHAADHRWSRSTTTPAPRVSLTAVTEPFSPSAVDLLRWAETLSAIARTGLGFTQSLYEKERFEEVLKVAADIRAGAIEEAEADALFEEWLADRGRGRAGYVTPKVAVAAIVGNERGELLLTQRADSGFWLYPGGLGRRRLLAVGDRGEGGLRGDRHRGGAGVARRGARRPPPRLRPDPAVLDAVPLPHARRRAAGPSARDPRRSGSSGATPCRSRSAGIHRWGRARVRGHRRRVRPCDFDPPRTPPWRGEG